MRKILYMVKKEFLQLRRDKRMVAMLFISPVVQLILLGYAASVDVKNIRLVICDLDYTNESRELIQHYLGSRYFILAGYVDKMDEIDDYLRSGRAGLALIVPKNFGRDLLAKKNPQLAVIADGSDSNTGEIGLNYASIIAARYARTIIVRQAVRSALIKTIDDLPLVTAETRAWFNPGLKSSDFMVPAVLVQLLMVITLVMTSLAIVKEKETGTIEQIVVTPIRDVEFILGKMIPFTIIGFIEIFLVLAVSLFVFHVPLRGNICTLLVLSLLFVIVSLGLGLLVSSVSKTQQQAMMTAQFFIMIPFIILSGFVFPIANMPKIIQYLTYLIPVRYFLEIVRGLFLKGDGLRELYPQALSLLAMGVAVFALSIYSFRRSLR
ncbi:MAG: ABC transporter permease [Bacteroidota bacterium]